MHKWNDSDTIPNAYKQNERYIVFILLHLKFCRFRFKDKQKRLSEDPHRLRTLQRYVFLRQYNALEGIFCSSGIYRKFEGKDVWEREK